MTAVDGIRAAALQRLFEATTELVMDCDPGALAEFPQAAEAATDLAAALLDHFHPSDVAARRLKLVGPSRDQRLADEVERAVPLEPTVHDIPSNHVRRIP